MATVLQSIELAHGLVRQRPCSGHGCCRDQPPRAASLDAKILNYANDDARQYIHYSIHIYEVVHASSSSLCQCLANRQPLPTSTLMPKGRGCELAASRLETSGRTVGPNDKNPPKN